MSTKIPTENPTDEINPAKNFTMGQFVVNLISERENPRRPIWIQYILKVQLHLTVAITYAFLTSYNP